MDLNKAIQLIKKHKNKIEYIEENDMIGTSELIDDIKNSDGKCKIEIANIVYKNGIKISVETDPDLEINNSCEWNKLFHDITEVLLHKISLLEVALTGSINMIYDITPYEETLEEIAEIEQYERDHANEIEEMSQFSEDLM